MHHPISRLACWWICSNIRGIGDLAEPCRSLAARCVRYITDIKTLLLDAYVTLKLHTFPSSQTCPYQFRRKTFVSKISVLTYRIADQIVTSSSMTRANTKFKCSTKEFHKFVFPHITKRFGKRTQQQWHWVLCCAIAPLSSDGAIALKN